MFLNANYFPKIVLNFNCRKMSRAAILLLLGLLAVSASVRAEEEDELSFDVDEDDFDVETEDEVPSFCPETGTR